MSEGLKGHMPVVVVVLLAAIAGGAFALSRVVGAASDLDVEAFSLDIILIPSMLMLAASFIIMLTASEVGRQLYLVVVGASFVCGVVSMVVTSMWMSDASIAAQLLANSPEGTVLTPVAESPLTVIRDLAAFIVAPTVGSILGVWIGSRLHSVKSDGPRRKR